MNLTYTDPRLLDGNPYEVAEAACQQANKVLDLARRATFDAMVMARNAELSRQIEAGQDPDAPGWIETAAGASFKQTLDRIDACRTKMLALTRSAGYDPITSE